MDKKYKYTAAQVCERLGITRGRLTHLCMGERNKGREPVYIENVDWVRIIRNGRACVMFAKVPKKKHNH